MNSWGYSSVVEHSTADREVPGSNPGVPYFFKKVFYVPTLDVKVSHYLLLMTLRSIHFEK